MKLPVSIRRLKQLAEHAKLFFENLIKSSFQMLNQKIHFKITFKKIKEETTEHVGGVFSAFKKIVLPMSVVYLLTGLLLGNNVIDSLFLSVLVFIYSSFLPDLLSPFRTKNRQRQNLDKSWLRNCLLLFLAPLFIVLLWGDGTPIFRTAEHFHNLRSLGAYSVFLSLLGFVFYVNVPFSLGRILEMFSLAIFGSIGYAVHLRIDGIL
jgi:hypothetical protein